MTTAATKAWRQQQLQKRGDNSSYKSAVTIYVETTKAWRQQQLQKHGDNSRYKSVATTAATKAQRQQQLQKRSDYTAPTKAQRLYSAYKSAAAFAQGKAEELAEINFLTFFVFCFSSFERRASYLYNVRDESGNSFTSNK